MRGTPVIADRAYDSDLLRQQVASLGLTLIAPHRRGRRKPAPTMDDDCADTVAVGSSNEPLPGSSVSDVSKPDAISTASSTMAPSIWLAFSSTKTLMKWALPLIHQCYSRGEIADRYWGTPFQRQRARDLLPEDVAQFIVRSPDQHPSIIVAMAENTMRQKAISIVRAVGAMLIKKTVLNRPRAAKVCW